MIEKPKAEDYKNELAMRGTGEIGESYGYLQYTDPAAYYYEKLKAQNNPYLKADMWAEAAKRGEINTLLSAIMSQPTNRVTIKNDKGEEVSKDISANEYLNTWSDWEGYSDYDSYMLALSIPNLDDEKKVDRTTTLEDGTEYSFGEYTDKEWATKIFEEQVGHWQAEKDEEDKKNKTFWEHLGDFCKTTFVDVPLRILGGIVDFVGDIWNLFEGVANIFVNWSGDAEIGDRFLYSFQNDDMFKQASDGIRKAAFELEYDTLLVNSIDAYEQGYRGWNGEVFDVGYTWIGQTVNGISQSIGYMLPSIAIQFIPGVGQGITAATTAAKVGTVGAKVGAYLAKNVGRLVFYTGIFSGSIKNTVNTAKMNGISYQDLNAGTVIANAALKAVAQYAIEEALSWIIGASGLDRMFGQTYAGKLPKIGVKAPTTEIGAAVRVIAGGVKGALKEGLEEFLQDTSDGLIDLVFGANGDKLFREMGEETLNISNLLNSFVAGALTSIIMGTVGSAKFIWKRGYGTDVDGKAYKLGFFQSIDYANSLRLMNEWQQTINDTSIKEDLRLDAAMKLATAYDTMSQIFRSLGESETITANKTLIAQAAVEDAKQSALMQMSAPEYAGKLMDDFMTNATEAQKRYISQKAEEAIKKAAERKEKGLKESLVTKIKTIFTRQSKVDTDIKDVDNVTQETVIDTLDKIRGMAIVAHDGTYVGFSGDVLFVPADMLANITDVLKMAECRDAVEAVIPKLSQSQKKMLVQQFEKATGTEGTIEQAATALLFDKNFYCSVLFLTAERKGYKPEALQMLATIDQIVKNKLVPEMAKGNLREDIFMQVMNRIQDNMRGGLINFCTKYAKVDLGEISNEVLSSDVKEAIRDNPNFLYTELIDKCIYNYKTINEQDRNRLVRLVENMTSLAENYKKDIISALDSGNQEQIADAGISVEFIRRNAETEMSKILYLPASTQEQMVQTTIDGITDYTGIQWDDFVQGNIDATKFTADFSKYLKSIGQLDLSDAAQRLRFLDNIIFERSSHNFALDANGNILKVINKEDFCKARYAGANGIKNLKEDIKTGKVKVVQDISKLKLNPAIGKIKLKYAVQKIEGQRAQYSISTKTIRFSAIAKNVDSIMHEITHIAQDVITASEQSTKVNRKLTSGEVSEVKSSGGTPTRFDALPKKTINSIMNWLKKHRPIFYALTQDASVKPHEVIYFALDGELKARTTADVFVRECGFLYNSDETKLIAPDGTAWDLTTGKANIIASAFKEYISQEQTRLDTISKNLNTFKSSLEEAKNQLSKLKPGTEEYAKVEQQVKGFQRTVAQFENEEAKYKKNLGMSDTRADAALTRSQKEELKNDQQVQRFMKDGFLKSADSTPVVWYRGNDYGEYDTMSTESTVRKLGEFYTTSYNEASLYGEERGIITNITREETMVLNMNGRDFNTIGDKLSDKMKAFNEKLYNKYKVFTEALGTADVSVNEAEQIIRKELGDKANTWDAAVKEAMEKYNLNKNEAVKFIVSTAALEPGKHAGIEALIPIAIAQGKSAIVIQNVVDGSGNAVNELVLLKSGRQMRVTTDDYYADVSVGEDKESNRVYISDKEAKGTKLENWVKAGKRLINKDVKNFVIATTKDFDKLSPTVQRMINETTLTRDTLQKYVATAAHINDFTFQAIARDFYHNEEVANLTYKQMTDIFNQIADFAAMAKFIENGNKAMSFKELMEQHEAFKQRLSKDSELANKYKNESEFLKQKKVIGGKGTYYDRTDIDISQLNTLFFRLYDGTLNSLKQINSLAKDIAYHQNIGGNIGLTENATPMTAKGGEQKYEYGWQSRAKQARTNYEISTDTSKALDGIDTRDKVMTIKQNNEEIAQKELRSAFAGKELTQENKMKAIEEYNNRLTALQQNLVDAVKSNNEEVLNQMYLAALGFENNKLSEEAYTELVTRKQHVSPEQKSTANQFSSLMKRGAAIARTDLANRKVNFDKLPDNLKQYFVRTKNGYVFNFADSYKISKIADDKLRHKAQAEAYKEVAINLGEKGVSQLNTDLAKVRQIFADERAKEKQTRKELLQAKREAEQTKARLERMARKTFNQKGNTTETPTKAQSMKEKIAYKYKVKIHETNFSFNSNTEANNVVKNVLNTQFSKRAESKVQGLISENQDTVVTSGKEFFTQNAGTFLNSTLSEIEDAVAWFLDSELRMQNATEDEFKIYQAVKQLFLGYVLSQTKADGVYAGFNNNLRQKIESTLHTMASTAGTVLSHQKEILDAIDPLHAMSMADMEIDGVKINDDLKAKLFDAIMSNNIEKIQAAEQEVYKFIREHSPKGQSFLRRVTNFRSMAMLSSPMTWLRNKVSNFMLKRIYKVSDAIGQHIFTGKHVEGQLKLNKQVTPQIQAFINEHFIDNKLFDSFMGNLSKYNPSDITERKNIGEKATKEQIMAHMVLKSMYSDYYNNETFKSPLMKKMHEFIMKRLSDNNYVRASAVRTFGKILAEKGYDISNNEVTDSIMNDFANAVGFAMAEYMHSDNFFHDIERIIADKSEVGHFVYKLFMPYAASSWNWFKAMIKLSPIGLGRSIIQMARLEKNVAKAQANFLAGKTQITGELAEYMIRRDFGQGVVGTILWGVGIALACLGFVRLEDDDYGTPKLRIGNIEIDISSIFGSSSLLAGAAFVTQMQKNGVTWDGFVKGMNGMLDVWSDQLPIMDIVQIDMYSNGSFSTIADNLGSILLSFIPNGVKWLAGGTYTGNLKKTTFLDRAMASIPGLGNFVQKKIDPYTGKEEDAGIIGILNRLIPYFSYHVASQNQSNTTALGLNKKMLNGKYSINGENFNVKGADLTAINQAYGKWNADDLTKFYNNQLGVKVKVGNTYKVLKYNQMDGDQQKRAVQSLMSNNAELAKILAWTKVGNKYYASSEIYNKLRKAGYTTNIYRGTKGFVKK